MNPPKLGRYRPGDRCRQRREVIPSFERNRQPQSVQRTNGSPGSVSSRCSPTSNGRVTVRGRIRSGIGVEADSLSAARTAMVSTSTPSHREAPRAASRSATSVQPVTTTGEFVSVSLTTTTNLTPPSTRANRQPSVLFHRSCPSRIASLTVRVDTYRPGCSRRSRKWSVSA